MTTKAVYAGIDVSKNALDIASTASSKPVSVSYDDAGIRRAVLVLKRMSPVLVVLEATGKLESRLVAALQAAGLPIVVVNPRQVRDYAKAKGILAKTDVIDAAVLAYFGEAVRPDVRPLPSPEERQLDGYLTRRRQLVEMIVAEQNRRNSAEPEQRAGIDAHLDYLHKAVADVDRDLDRKVKESPSWRERDDLLRSVPGVGHVVSLTLLAELPELGP